MKSTPNGDTMHEYVIAIESEAGTFMRTIRAVDHDAAMMTAEWINLNCFDNGRVVSIAYVEF